MRAVSYQQTTRAVASGWRRFTCMPTTVAALLMSEIRQVACNGLHLNPNGLQSLNRMQAIASCQALPLNQIPCFVLLLRRQLRTAGGGTASVENRDRLGSTRRSTKTGTKTGATSDNHVTFIVCGGSVHAEDAHLIPPLSTSTILQLWPRYLEDPSRAAMLHRTRLGCPGATPRVSGRHA